jgi:hypothetical protein
MKMCMKIMYTDRTYKTYERIERTNIDTKPNTICTCGGATGQMVSRYDTGVQIE